MGTDEAKAVHYSVRRYHDPPADRVLLGHSRDFRDCPHTDCVEARRLADPSTSVPTGDSA